MTDLKVGHGFIVRKAHIRPEGSPVVDGKEMGIRQLLDTTTGVCTYLLWDKETEDAILINPVDTESSRDLLLTTDLHLVYVVNSHGLDKDHHISVGTRLLKEKIKGIQVILTTTKSDKDVDADILLENDDILIHNGDEIHFGSRFVTALATPSPSTPGDMTFLLDDKKAVLTSSALLMPGNGRCDIPATELLYLYALPDSTIVFPGYYYDTLDNEEPRSSTIGQEKKHNPILAAVKMD